jgi:hypothetical protein
LTEGESEAMVFEGERRMSIAASKVRFIVTDSNWVIFET